MTPGAAIACVIWCALCCAFSWWRGALRGTRWADKRWLRFVEQRDAEWKVATDALFGDALRMVARMAGAEQVSEAIIRKLTELRAAELRARDPRPGPRDPTK